MAREIESIRRIPDRAMRVQNAAVWWLRKNGISHESGGGTWEETTNGRTIRKGCFFVGGPAPSTETISRIVRKMTAELGEGRIALREIETSPHAIGTGWRILIGHKEAGLPSPCPEIRLEHGSSIPASWGSSPSVGSDGSLLALGVLALVAAAGAVYKRRQGSRYEVLGTTGDENPIAYGGGSILRMRDGRTVWVIVDSLEWESPRNLRQFMADYLDANRARFADFPEDYEPDPNDSQDRRAFLPLPVYVIDVDEDVSWVFREKGRTPLQVAEDMLSYTGNEEAAEEALAWATSEDPVERVRALELYVDRHGIDSFAYRSPSLTEHEIVEAWPHFGGKVARHSFRGTTWVEPWRNR
jgi:hypothetical protein